MHISIIQNVTTFLWTDLAVIHDDVIKWKHFLHHWPFVRGIHWPPVNSPHKRPVTRSLDVFFDLSLNKRLSKQSWGWWFETQLRPLWRHCNVIYLWWGHDMDTLFALLVLYGGGGGGGGGGGESTGHILSPIKSIDSTKIQQYNRTMHSDTDTTVI